MDPFIVGSALAGAGSALSGYFGSGSGNSGFSKQTNWYIQKTNWKNERNAARQAQRNWDAIYHEDTRRYEKSFDEARRQFELNFARSQWESDRDYNEAKRQWTEAFVRQAFESDRAHQTQWSQWKAAYDRQAYESNRSFDRQKYEWENSLINMVNQAKSAGLHPLFALGGSASMGGGTYMPGSYAGGSVGASSYAGGSLPGSQGVSPTVAGGPSAPPASGGPVIGGQSNTGSFARDGANAVGVGVAEFMSSLGTSLSQAYQQSKDAELVDAQVLAYKASAQRDLAEAQAFNSRSSLNQEQATVSPRPAQKIAMNPQPSKKAVTMKMGYSTFKSRPGENTSAEIAEQFGPIRAIGAEVTDIARAAWEQWVADLAATRQWILEAIGR